MKAVAALCALMLALGAALNVSADPSWLSSDPSVKTAAKTSSYYADALETELACLSQMNFRSCRFQGFNPGFSIIENDGDEDDGEENDFFFPVGDLSFQTDFACCSKEHRHGHKDDIGLVGADGKIGTCDWNVNVYWWYSDSSLGPVPTPVLTADGSAVKFGEVTGTCYFSSAADQCDHPLCERMVLSFQGGLYVSRAYGFVGGDNFGGSQFAPFQDTCAGEEPNLPAWPIPFFEVNRNGAKAGSEEQAASTPTPAAAKPAASTPTLAATQALGTKAPGSKYFTDGPQLPDFLEWIMDVGRYNLDGNGCVKGDCQARKGIRQPLKRPHKSATGETVNNTVKASMANADYDHAHEEKTYAGYAMVISGPFSVVSSNDNKIKQTGIMEFTPTFQPDVFNGPSVPVRPTQKWPIVRGQTAKLRFTKENEEQYSAKDNYKGEGKDNYNAYEPDRKDAYYGNDGDKKDYGRDYYRDGQRC